MPDDIITLRELLEREQALRWAAHTDAHTAQELAFQRFIESNDKKLHEMNQVRQQLDRQAGSFISIPVHELALQRLGVIERWQAGVEAKFWALGVAFTIFTIVFNVLSRYLFPGMPP